jgi:hypothetical protein
MLHQYRIIFDKMEALAHICEYCPYSVKKTVGRGRHPNSLTKDLG